MKPIRIVEVGQDIPMQASKWLKLQVLVERRSLEDLFQHLGDFEIYLTGKLTEKGGGIIAKEEFLDVYEKYICDLKQGQAPDERVFAPYFSCVLSATPEAVYALYTSTDQQIIRVAKPVIQMQAHTLDYSPRDGKLRSMVFGVDSVQWGIQFSYPQLYLENNEVVQALHQTEYPNTSLFKRLQEWVRTHTLPTPFEIEGKKQNAPVRIGQECFGWINTHPQLQKKGLRVLSPELEKDCV